MYSLAELSWATDRRQHRSISAAVAAIKPSAVIHAAVWGQSCMTRSGILVYSAGSQALLTFSQLKTYRLGLQLFTFSTGNRNVGHSDLYLKLDALLTELLFARYSNVGDLSASEL